MREILTELDRWQRDARQVAIATLVAVRRSAPRPAGARMLITSDGLMSGSISAGCVEGDVAERAKRVLDTGEPVIATYGISDEQGFEVGLSCGGEIDVLVEPFVESGAWKAFRQAVEAGCPAALALGIRPDSLIARPLAITDEGTTGSIDPALDELIAEQARQALGEGSGRTITLPWRDGEADIFIDACVPPPHLYIIGATQVSAPLAAMATQMGFSVSVVDARSALTTRDRFPQAEVVTAWPDDALAERDLDEHAYVVVLTHDPKFDLPALEVALRSNARYIGAMGSRKTHARRVEHLREQGFDDASLQRIHAPVGLDLGGQQPEELALAILGEIVAARHGRRLQVTESA